MPNGVSVTPDALRDIVRKIEEIDVQLDAASGSSASVSRLAESTLLDEQATNYKDFVDSVVQGISDADSTETKVATVLALGRILDSTFKSEVADFMKARVEELSKQQEESDLTDEEISELEAQRKQLNEQYKAVRQLLEMFDQDISDIPEPKIRTGSRGKRGPRTLNTYHYRVNETDLPEESDSLAMVAKIAGVKKVSELKKFITDQGIDLKSPPNEWQAELPNKQGTVYATKKVEFIEADAQDDSDEEE